MPISFLCRVRDRSDEANNTFCASLFNQSVKCVAAAGQSTAQKGFATTQQDFTTAMPRARNHVDNAHMQQVYCSA
jgi:hypothetical protein